MVTDMQLLENRNTFPPQSWMDRLACMEEAEMKFSRNHQKVMFVKRAELNVRQTQPINRLYTHQLETFIALKQTTSWILRDT